ncbi:MAG: CvpA family protein [Clostridia bacterium]|nr:CvpA family protein [Clostridia bacterium]
MDPMNKEIKVGGFAAFIKDMFSKDSKTEVVAPKNAAKKNLIAALMTVVFAGVLYYLMLPVMNFKEIKMYLYFGIVVAAFPVFSYILHGAFLDEDKQNYVKRNSKPFIILILLLVLVVVGGLISSAVFFRAKSYSRIMSVQTGDFANDVNEIDFSSVPMLDEASAQKLGARQLGELSEYVSQYEDAQYYTQINYKDKPVRVTTLRYANIIKWLTNMKNGIPAYMIVDMTTQEVKVVKLQDGIKYSPSEHFNRLLKRHLRFSYPTYILDNPTFEIDDDGNPYWICSRLDKTVGLFGGDDVKGIVIVNAVTGETSYHDIEEVKTSEALRWIDRVYSSSLLVQQYNYYGEYSSGFWNSVLGQKNVKITTQGSNYLALNDDVYMYTGITSVTNDDSIIGFILCNQRTKETTYYKISGATEYSAMGSAEGKVQQYSYVATFPLLLNINGEPTFFMALKDSEGLVKMYSLVNVSQYQIVVTAPTLEECLEQYYAERSKVKVTNDDEKTAPEQNDEMASSGVVEEIRSAVLGGETFYYIKVEGDSHYYCIAASYSENVVILNKGDSVKILVNEKVDMDQKIIQASSIEIV